MKKEGPNLDHHHHRRRNLNTSNNANTASSYNFLSLFSLPVKSPRYYSFVDYLLATTCLVLLIASFAAGCTPTYLGEDLGFGATNVIIKEGSSFRMTCRVSHFHSIKWTLNGREINAKLQDSLGIQLKTHGAHKGNIFTEIDVFNATKLHSGEYKCASPCLDGSNTGVKVLVIFGENPEVAGEKVYSVLPSETNGVMEILQYVRHTVKGRREEIKCTANNVKSIEWVKGSSKTPGTPITPCKDKKTKPDAEETKEEFLQERDAPCVSAVTTEDIIVSNGGKIKRKILYLEFPVVRVEDIGPYTCVTQPDDSPTNLDPFGTTIYLQEQIKRFKRSDYEEEERNATINKSFKVERLTPDGRLYPKGHRSITVIAGDTLSIYCNVSGLGANENESDVEMKWFKDEVQIDLKKIKSNKNMANNNQTGERTAYHSDHWFDYLEADAKHRGLYKCEATHKKTKKTSKYNFYVRVKDKLMPLWPFLGICGEVAVLCIIIVVYEKRRNKQELEESDTDGSPDQ